MNAVRDTVFMLIMKVYIRRYENICDNKLEARQNENMYLQFKCIFCFCSVRFSFLDFV